MIRLSVVLSVRIPKWVKERLESFGVDLKELVRRRLIEEVEMLEMENLARRLDELAGRVRGKVDVYELAGIVDEERKNR